MDDQANFALLVLLLESARQWNQPGDFAEGTFVVWTNAIRQLKALLPNASPPAFSSVDQNLLNAFINAAIVIPLQPLDQVVYNAQIAVLNEPGMQEHYELLLLIEIAVVARSDKTLSWQDVFIQAVQNIGLTGLEPQLIMGWNIDMNVVNAFVQQLRSNPDKSIADAINDAKNSVSYTQPAVAELKSIYCGHEGFPCCADPVDSCREPDLLCDWNTADPADATCRGNLWPPQDAYSVNQTHPPDELDTDWTEEVQGIATDGRFWYVVQGDEKDDSDRALWRVPFNVDFEADWDDLDGVYKVDDIELSTGCLHWGDPDFHAGRVYVPMENCGDGMNRLAEFDAASLKLLGMALTHTNHAASVAFHPISGEIYIMNHFYASDPQTDQHLNVYAPRGTGRFELQLRRELKLEGPVLDRLQGIAFSPEGKLYVSSDMECGSGGVYAYQVSPNRAIFQRYLFLEMHKGACSPLGDGQELQGLTVRDMSWLNEDGDVVAYNQIHVLLLHNICTAQDNAWFKHIGVSDSRF